VLYKFLLTIVVLFTHAVVMADMCGPEKTYWENAVVADKGRLKLDASCFFHRDQYPNLFLIHISDKPEPGVVRASHVVNSKSLKQKSVGFMTSGYDLISDMELCFRLKESGYRNPKILKYGLSIFGELEVDAFDASKMYLSERSFVIGLGSEYLGVGLNSTEGFDSLLVNQIYPLMRQFENKSVLLLLPSHDYVEQVVNTKKRREGVFYSVVSPEDFERYVNQILEISKVQKAVPKRYRCG